MNELRYQVRPVPYGLTHSADLNATWSVVDTRPEIEEFSTPAGAKVVEDKPPLWRTVAWCSKESHAKLIVKALTVWNAMAAARCPRLSARPEPTAVDMNEKGKNRRG